MRFLPMANLHITMKNQGKAEQFVRDLDLKRAIATTSFVMDGVRYTRTTFASLADGVIVCHIKASRKGALNIDVTLDSPFEHQTQKTSSGVMLKVKGQDQEGIKAALTAECVADLRTDGTEATIIVSAATNFVNYHDVSGNAAQRNADYINKVKLMSYAQLEKRHVSLPEAVRYFFSDFANRYQCFVAYQPAPGEICRQQGYGDGGTDV